MSDNDKMKTETKIAEENIEDYIKLFEDGIKGNPWTDIIRKAVKRDAKERCLTHKASCQRFLPNRERTLNWLRIFITKFSVRTNVSERMEVEAECRKLDDENTDLKTAIKKYDEAGI